MYHKQLNSTKRKQDLVMSSPFSQAFRTKSFTFNNWSFVIGFLVLSAFPAFLGLETKSIRVNFGDPKIQLKKLT